VGFLQRQAHQVQVVQLANQELQVSLALLVQTVVKAQMLSLAAVAHQVHQALQVETVLQAQAGLQGLVAQ
jgi:hypothetical protein